MPLAAIRLVAPGVRAIGAAYFVIQLAVFIFTMVVLLFNQLFNLHIEGILAIFPLSALLMAVVEEADGDWLIPAIAVLAASVVIILLRSRGYWQELRAIRDQAEMLGEATPVAPTPAADHAG